MQKGDFPVEVAPEVSYGVRIGVRIGELLEDFCGAKIRPNNALCGAHQLRELNGLIEQASKWGQQVHDWFMALYRQCGYGEATVPQDPALGQAGIWGRLHKADKEEPAPEKRGKRPGKSDQRPQPDDRPARARSGCICLCPSLRACSGFIFSQFSVA